MAVNAVLNGNTNVFNCSRSSGSIMISRILAVLLVVVVIIVLIVAGMFAMNQIVDNSYDNVDAIVQLQGNDVVVTIIGGADADKVAGLHAYIDGMESNAPANTKRSITIGEPVVFTNLAKGVTGTGFVVVEAIFQDGSTGVVTFARMKFS